MLDPSVIISAISAFAAAAGLVYSGLSFRASGKQNYVSELKEFDDEITQVEESEKSTSDQMIFVEKYLNCLDRLAFLALKKFVPNAIPIYFRLSYSKALNILSEEKYRQFEPHSRYLVDWCKNNKVTEKEYKDALVRTPQAVHTNLVQVTAV